MADFFKFIPGAMMLLVSGGLAVSNLTIVSCIFAVCGVFFLLWWGETKGD